uniref:C2H2-type domain-containing protein n=1 Tax=Eptatretus burgeri TaxID=7764 RepID=A0A8C4NAF7_EPTBU
MEACDPPLVSGLEDGLVTSVLFDQAGLAHNSSEMPAGEGRGPSGEGLRGGDPSPAKHVPCLGLDTASTTTAVAAAAATPAAAAAAAASSFVSSAKEICCNQCSTSFPSLQAYMEHHCPSALPPLLKEDDSEGSEVEDSDVENLLGEIVYHPDGSAYIVENDKEVGAGEDGGGLPPALSFGSKTRDNTHPQIVSTFHITSSLAQHFSLEQTSPNTSMLLPGLGPVLRSFHVYDVRHKSGSEYLNSDGSAKNSCLVKDVHSSIDLAKFDGSSLYGKGKPILMCFLCKLSFGYVRSFVSHAIHDHHMTLIDEERKLLVSGNVSAIIQGIGKDRDPLISFLEPKTPPSFQQALASEPNCDGPRPNFYGMFSGVHMPGMEALQNGPGSSKTSNCSPKMVGQMQALNSWGSNTLTNFGNLTNSVLKSPITSATLGRVTAGLAELSGNKGSEAKPSTDHESQKISIKSEPTDPEEEDFPEELFGADFEEEDEEDGGDGSQVRLGDSASSNELSNLGNQSFSQPSFLPHMLSSTPKGSSLSSFQIFNDGSANGRSSASAMLMSEGDANNSSRCENNPSAGLSRDDTEPNDNVAEGGQYRVFSKAGNMSTRDGDLLMATGEESPKADHIMSPHSLSFGSHLTMAMQSRTSCKTLKCPKCNWHYKYQQTLDAHMKEKHPEPGDACAYCQTGQPHPRLARGESYTCGYKPFRCDVCNYSTTTKGNLSIHMQSDKHLNNMQSLQNGSAEPPSFGHHLPSTAGNMPLNMVPKVGVSPAAKQRPPQQKPVWRCEVCDYETNVARNLRIHMTSEKHAHNLLLLQQSMKTHGLPPLGLVGGALGAPSEAELYQYYLVAAAAAAAQSAGLPDRLKLEGLTESQILMAGFPLDALSIGLPSSLGGAEMATDVRINATRLSTDESTVGPTSVPGESEPCIFQCSVCNAFSTDSVEALALHASAERRLPEDEWKAVSADGAHTCRLCQYATPLRANFQLHCKTDKHVAKYQLVAHIREGGQANQWRLKCAALGSPVQLKCNACDYYANSLEKLGMHTSGQRHEISIGLHQFLQRQERAAGLGPENCRYVCSLCDIATHSKLSLLQHARSLKHQQSAGLHRLQRLQQGIAVPEGSCTNPVEDFTDVFTVLPGTTTTTTPAAEFQKYKKLDLQTSKQEVRLETTDRK